jgi:hypothetical protein
MATAPKSNIVREDLLSVEGVTKIFDVAVKAVDNV